MVVCKIHAASNLVSDAHKRWRLVDEQRLGVDRLEVYERTRDR